MKNFPKSFIERWRRYLLFHFSWTKWGHNLAKLKNTHNNERCFIIGNGPSLKVEDLDKLKSEYTFAFNRIYYIFEHTAWRPTFYCIQDSKIANASADEIRDAINSNYLFAPINLKWYEGVDIDTDYFFSPKSSSNQFPEFSQDIPSFIGSGNTVTYTAIQLAVYMGFTEIYLIGVDHSFQTYTDNEGVIHTDPSAKDYFCDKYNSDKDQLYIPNLDASTCSYIAAQEFAKRNGIKIYNATRGGKLEVFPRIDFDVLFPTNECSVHS